MLGGCFGLAVGRSDVSIAPSAGALARSRSVASRRPRIGLGLLYLILYRPSLPKSTSTAV